MVSNSCNTVVAVGIKNLSWLIYFLDGHRGDPSSLEKGEPSFFLTPLIGR